MSRIKLEMEVDLDPIPGEFHTSESAQSVIQRVLENNIGHYKPVVWYEKKRVPKITTVRFQDSNNRYGNKEAVANMCDGEENVFVVAWFDDELHFSPEEFVGKTIEEARDFKVEKDVKYLQT